MHQCEQERSRQSQHINVGRRFNTAIKLGSPEESDEKAGAGCYHNSAASLGFRLKRHLQIKPR